MSCMYEAIIKDDLEAVKLMTIRGRTIGQSYYLELACEHGSIKIVQHILNLDVSKNFNLTSSLTLAAANGYYEICKLLIDKGAKLEEALKKSEKEYKGLKTLESIIGIMNLNRIIMEIDKLGEED